MSARDRQQTLRLPEIEEDKPFSSLFGSTFDMATVESTAQLADSSIFITPSGSRFRFQRLADPVAVPSSEKPQPTSLKPTHLQRRPEPPSPPPEAPVPVVISGKDRDPLPTAVSATDIQSPQPRFQMRTRPPQPSPSSGNRRASASYPPSQPAAVAPAAALLSASSPRSSVGSANSARFNAPDARRNSGDRDTGPQNAVVEDAVAMMEGMGLGEHEFGAAALYLHSDGGVQAAETLTDSLSTHRLQSRSESVSSHSQLQPSDTSDAEFTYQQPPYRHGFLDYQDSYYPFGSFSSTSGSIPHPRHQSLPYRGSASSQTPSRTSADGFVDPEFTNSDPFSPPAYAYSSHDTPIATPQQQQQQQPQPRNRQQQHQQQQHYGVGFSVGDFQSLSEKQTGGTSAPRSQSLPSLMEYSIVHSPPGPPLGSSSPHSSIARSSFMGGSSAAAVTFPDTGSDSDGGRHYSYDTQTPVFVRVHSPDPPPSSSPAPSSSDAALSSSSGRGHGGGGSSGGTTTDASSSAGSRDRDIILPGEDLLYDGAVRSGHAPAGPFEEGHLKVFRNTLSHDLRFHCRVGNNTETLWMKGAKARMVPLYGYDQRSLTVLIRDGDGDLDRRQRQQQLPQHNDALPIGPVAMYQFGSLKDLFALQSQLTGEQVVLDISSVKWIRLAKANSRSSEMYSSVRLQIWYEPRSRRATQSDVASFVTAGTALSGPLRERTVPNSSRLMVFLGRSDQYITCFITDDIEMEPKGHTSASLKPRKYGGILDRRNSRPGIRARLEKKCGSEPAGLDIAGEPYNPDVEQSFDLYKTFEIEFETSPSQVNFVQAWNEVIEERRKQRAKLARIQEDMRRETFSPREALTIRT